MKYLHMLLSPHSYTEHVVRLLITRYIKIGFKGSVPSYRALQLDNTFSGTYGIIYCEFGALGDVDISTGPSSQEKGFLSFG